MTHESRYIRERAIADIKDSLRQLSLAYQMAWDDIKERYVRTFLGPLWIVISTGIWFWVIAFVMSHVFKQSPQTYIPYLVSGLLMWQYISSSLSESNHILLQARRIITTYNLPIGLHFLRFALRNLIIFLHTLIILAVVLMIFPQKLSGAAALFFVGMFLNVVNVTALSVLIALANTRYRDVHIALTNVLQIAPYITPVFWHRDILGTHAWIADINPLYHMIEIMRAPLIGVSPEPLSWLVVCVCTLISCILALYVFLKCRHRIIFWI